MSATNYDVQTAIETWRGYRAQRLELESLAKKIKEELEEPAKAEILMYLDLQNMTGVKTKAGTASKTNKTHVEVTNIEATCLYMLQTMAQAYQSGKPLADCLLLQKTAHKGAITELVQQALDVDDLSQVTEEAFNQEAAKFGVKIASRPDLSFSNK